MKFKKFKFKKVRSTNDTAIRLIRKNNFTSGMVVSETQLNGKGQYGRKWFSLKGNLFVSFFHELSSHNLSISMITRNNCLLVKKLLSKYIKKKIIYKKPNDLLIEKKKVSGILQEIISVSNKIFLITGIGINISKNPNIKNYPSTNMCELTKKNISKPIVEKNLKELFEKNLTRIYKIKGINR